MLHTIARRICSGVRSLGHHNLSDLSCDSLQIFTKKPVSGGTYACCKVTKSSNYSMSTKSREATNENIPESHPEYKKVMETLTPDDWVERWKYHDTRFHQSAVDQELMIFIDKLINRRENLKVFVPLCGKSVDMKWLADIGCTVVGVEISANAIEEFFKESDLEYTKERIEAIPATLYKSLDNKNQIYCCDLYSISSDLIGQFDTLWDKQSFAAINVEEGPRYISLMKSLLMPQARYLLSTLNFDRLKYEGPPHCHSDEDLIDLFGDTMTVEKLREQDISDGQKAERYKVDWLTTGLHLMVNKK